jgi:hypothetical protein
VLLLETIVVCCEIHTKHVSKLCVKNVELFDIKPVGM